MSKAAGVVKKAAAIWMLHFSSGFATYSIYRKFR